MVCDAHSRSDRILYSDGVFMRSLFAMAGCRITDSSLLWPDELCVVARFAVRVSQWHFLFASESERIHYTLALLKYSFGNDTCFKAHISTRTEMRKIQRKHHARNAMK